MNSISRAADAVAQLFPAMYLRFHARSRASRPLTPQMHMVLQHLSMSGPLTVTEAAHHMSRAQSVMSEIVDGLVKKGLLARMPDSRDRRRTLVWLTDQGQVAMSREHEVLSRELLASAIKRLTPQERTALITGMQALVRAADEMNQQKEQNQ